MSAYFALCRDDRVLVFSDGALWDGDDHTLVGVSQKIRTVEAVPGVIVTRGVAGFGETLTKAVRLAFEQAGNFDLAMVDIETSLQPYRGRRSPGPQCDVMIAGISERHGPVVYQWATTDFEDRQAFTLHRSKGLICGTELTDAQRLQLAGLRPHDVGIQVMGYVRSLRLPSINRPDGPEDYMVGGHIDFAEVSLSGVTVERIHTWDDRVGTKIDPFSQSANVVPMNRKERRAMKRLAQFA